jgi:transglutaminase-like putative cysteine protease
VLVPAFSLFILADSPGEHTVRTRQFALTYRVNVPAAGPSAKRLDLWVPVPHDDEFQQVRSLSIDTSIPYQIATADNGSRYLHLTTSPANDFQFVMRLDAQRTERWQHDLHKAPEPVQDPPGLSSYLKPDRLVPLDDKIRGWAEEVVTAAHAQTDLEKARAIYNHVVATVKYDKSGTGWGRGDIYYACDARRGNCTDFHAIFIGYARAVGVPARFSIGFPIPKERGEGKIAGYHCWAEFYARGIGWIPVDASEAAKDPSRREYFFGALDENRLPFLTGRDLVLVPKQSGDPLNYFVYPYIEVDGKPYGVVQSSFEFKDRPSGLGDLQAPK